MGEHPAFGPRLRALRQRRGWTQAQLAERAGMHPQSVVKLEAGDREPAWSTLWTLAAALGVGLQDFADVEPGGPASGPSGRPRKAPGAAQDIARATLPGERPDEGGEGHKDRRKGKAAGRKE
jgi:transcriptional regulator with XRE-family HTH domain